ncbi:hypothetical protein BU24DRAFT_208028 [Aaosphaeria arxii CBS 175.79]|uniref:Uncharacterized protein n=1 Tax=Aaosphaeria arxii CBS 175.79 TaxID=1450172 RepID=A0A6A5XUU5_9PLEO|nr:uncharacterized protein BU24DRAFT_208028 [Aaosphaeria arxii CBS 175.79]KAF2016696.1 hypothetical protein BU24DRAFT_208028 [Aaosphaeria arxii CBS 175.79]
MCAMLEVFSIIYFRRLFFLFTTRWIRIVYIATATTTLLLSREKFSFVAGCSVRTRLRFAEGSGSVSQRRRARRDAEFCQSQTIDGAGGPMWHSTTHDTRRLAVETGVVETQNLAASPKQERAMPRIGKQVQRIENVDTIPYRPLLSRKLLPEYTASRLSD